MNLSDLRPPQGSRHKKKRIGRGPGSGWGVTAGRGEKGQKSRSGYKSKRGFEGGQMPLVRRVPKRGFTNIFRKEYAVVNLSRLNEIEGSDFTPEGLLAAGVIAKLRSGLKILGEGEIERAVRVIAHKASKSAVEKIEKAGGSVTLIAPPDPAAAPAAKKKAVRKAAPATVKPAAPKKAARKRKPAEDEE